MSKSMSPHIEEKTQEILRSFKISETPIPIERIVTALNIKVAYAADEKYSGLLLRSAGNTTVMGLNNSESFRRQRFTMAHELGHYYLDPKKKAFVDQKVVVDHRNNKAGKSENKKEMYANAFAAALLMPEHLLSNDFRRIVEEKKVFIDDHLIALANKYEVSREAMKFRLINLGLIRV